MRENGAGKLPGILRPERAESSLQPLRRFRKARREMSVRTGSRQRHNDVVHRDIEKKAVEQPRDDGLGRQSLDARRGENEDSRHDRGNQEVRRKTKGRGAKPARARCLAADPPGGHRLQHLNRR